MRRAFNFFCILLVACGGAGAQSFLLPSGVAFDGGGNLYVADAHRNQVFEVSLGGVTTVVAGTGEQGFAGEGTSATAALLNAPTAVAVAADGTVYIADTGNQRVRSVSQGIIRTVAGSGVKGFSGDGGDALQAKFSAPVGLALSGSGALLIADSGNHRVRSLAAGVITTVAGSGAQGFGGDGAAAVAALLDTPSGVAVMADGRMVIADAHNHRLRVVGVDGRISTVAGSGARGFSGDGGSALGAALDVPRGVAVMPDGSIVFADSDNQRLRRVDAAGVITTLVGNGVQGASAEATAGVAAPLDSPRAVALSSFGDAVFADARNASVRDHAPDAALYSVASRSAAVALSASATLVYGASGLTAVVQGDALQARGVVTLMEGASVIGTARVVNGNAVFAMNTMSAGTHVLTASYSGDGIHVSAVSAGVSLPVSKAPVVVAESLPAIAYAGLPVTLTARVGSTTTGTPTGAVRFLENGSVVATGTLVGGVASAVYLSPAAGAHDLVAAYSGDANFLGGSSVNSSLSVGVMPDFAIAAASSQQTVQGGTVASFALQVSGSPGPFSGSVSFGVSGLPKGATASFSPTAVVPGSSTTTVTLTIQTIALAERSPRVDIRWAGLLVLLLVPRRRRMAGLCAVLLLTATGCGDREFSAGTKAPAQTFTLQVAGTSTNLVGAVVTHSVPLTLTVQ